MIVLIISLSIIGCGSDEEVVEKVIETPVVPSEPVVEDVPETPAEEPKMEDTTNEDEAIEPVVDETDVKDEELVTEPANKKYTINVTTDGFDPATLTIKVGDTVEWKNIRTGNLDQVMIIGAQQCTKIKSGVLETDEMFSWTFDKAETCTIVDGITTTQTGKVTVE